MPTFVRGVFYPRTPVAGWRWALLVGLVTAAAAQADDWPFWRGPHHNDTINEHSGYNSQTKQWLPKDPTWSANAGEGSSSPVVTKDNVFVMGWKTGNDVITCLSLKTGDVQWTQSYPTDRYARHSTGDKSFYSGPSATPTYDAETQYLYTLGLDGMLACWDTNEKGQQIWKKNLYEVYKAPMRPNVGSERSRRSRSRRRDYGYTCAPLLYKNWLLVQVGAKTGNVIAFDKRTGQEKWRSENDDEGGHNGGLVPITVEGVDCVAGLTLRGLLVVRLDSTNAGKTVATYPWETDFGNNVVTPTVTDNHVLLTSAYNHMAMVNLKVTLHGAQKVWEGDFASGVCCPIVHSGLIFWAWKGIHCVDFKTGEKRWSAGKVGAAGSMILTQDEKLIIWANRGDLYLVNANDDARKKYQPLAQREKLMARDAWPHVVLAHRQLIVKDRTGAMKCFSLAGSSTR